MNRNEPNAAFRACPNVPIYDVNGRFAPGLTFLTANGEVVVSKDKGTFVAAAFDGVEVGGSGLGLGEYYYVASATETDCNVDLVYALRKKAALDLATKTTNCTSKIRAKPWGIPGNDYTMTWVQDGAVTGVGTLTLVGTDYTFTFKDGVTTVTNFEALVTASANLEVGTAGAVATLHTVDAFGSVNLANGVEGHARQVIDQTNLATLPAAVWNLAAVGSRTYGDLQRLNMAMVAGPVVDFTTNTLVFRCPVLNTIRATVTRDATGRTNIVLGTLSP